MIDSVRLSTGKYIAIKDELGSVEGVRGILIVELLGGKYEKAKYSWDALMKLLEKTNINEEE